MLALGLEIRAHGQRGREAFRSNEQQSSANKLPTHWLVVLGALTATQAALRVSRGSWNFGDDPI